MLRVFSVLGVAVAAFWFAIMLQFLFSMRLGWLPLRGELSDAIRPPARVTGFLLLDCLIGRAVGRLRATLWPPGPAGVHALGVGGLASIVRFTRAGVLETLAERFCVL